MFRSTTSLLAGLATVLCLYSCGSSQFTLSVDKHDKLAEGDNARIEIFNPKNQPIDSVVCYFQGRKQHNSSLSFDFPLNNIKLGKHNISAIIYRDSEKDSIIKELTIYARRPPKIYTYKILNSYPHDIKAYTQGLEFHNDTLYESTGLYGESSLRKVDYTTGIVLEQISIDKIYFGEGITLLNKTIYQLTWQNKVGFIYDMDFKKKGSFSYNQSKEGWGLCNDSKKIYKSDGSERIWTLNVNTLSEEESIQICSNTSVFSKANELEWIEGKIFANTYQKDGIMIINPENGAIEGVIDCRGLKTHVEQHKDLDVLNGIAFNPKTRTIFVTGKHWDKLFEIEILETKNEQ